MPLPAHEMRQAQGSAARAASNAAEADPQDGHKKSLLTATRWLADQMSAPARARLAKRSRSDPQATTRSWGDL